MTVEDRSRYSSTFVSFFKSLIDSNRKSQKELAREMGFNNPNFLSMIKSGNAKLPLDKAVVVAKTLNVNPAYFTKLVLEQFFPDKSDDIWEVFDNIVSSNEMALIRAIRTAYDEVNPAFTTPQIEEAVALLAHLNPPRRPKAPSV